MINILTVIISLTSAVMVAFIGHFLSEKRKRIEELTAFRLSAYTDFLNSISYLVTARRLGRTSDEIEELAKLNDAKTRICICSDTSVVEALIKFWKYGGTLEREEEILAFTQFCYEIRISLGFSLKDTLRLELSDILFNLQPSKYSYAAKENHDK